MTNLNEQDRNVATFRRLIEEGFSGGNADVVDETCAPDLVEHQDGFASPNREGVKGGIEFLHTMAPDVVVTVEEIDAVGDRVWARLRGRGTHGGPMLGGPTGRPFDITIMDVCRFRDGLIVEHWGVPDRFAQMTHWGYCSSRPQPLQRLRAGEDFIWGPVRSEARTADSPRRGGPDM